MKPFTCHNSGLWSVGITSVRLYLISRYRLSRRDWLLSLYSYSIPEVEGIFRGETWVGIIEDL